MSWENMLMAARRGEGPLSWARPLWRSAMRIRLPMVRPFWGFVYAARFTWKLRIWPLIAKIFYREPLLRYRATRLGRGVQLDGAIPLIFGNGRIEIGDDVVIGGRNTWTIGSKVSVDAELVIGDRVTIGYQNSITASVSVRIGDDTMLASNINIFDTPTHPISPARRLHHEPPRLDECSPVVIGRNCWIGSSAMILQGVTIGDNSIVAAGSIVTRSIPPNSLAAGAPATVKRSIAD